MHSLKRKLTEQLNYWKSKPGRLPLILWGARQVGKSTSVEAFGKEEFPNIHVFNFQQNSSLLPIFEGDLNPSHILERLSIAGKCTISNDDLIFFDEIQECPKAITSLKYFSESLPKQPIISAGSHLGLIKNEVAFPVGKVEFLALHPMNFFEFLENMEPHTHDHLHKEMLLSDTKIQEFYHQRALHWLRLYFCVGGLPAAVKAFAAHLPNELEGVRAAREVHHLLIQGYQGDFSKYAGLVNANHILRVFEATAMQLGQTLDDSVSKFKFSNIIPKKKGFDSIDGPLTWLKKSRLIIKTHLANRFEQPIKAFTKQNNFKIYLFDVGILNAMLGTPVEGLLIEDLGSYKGHLAENFVAQELFSKFVHTLTGWSESESEVEFVISRGANLCPIEVKASKRSRKSKSLDSLILKYQPELSVKVTGQNRGYHPERKILTLPIYLVSRLMETP